MLPLTDTALRAATVPVMLNSDDAEFQAQEVQRSCAGMCAYMLTANQLGLTGRIAAWAAGSYKHPMVLLNPYVETVGEPGEEDLLVPCLSFPRSYVSLPSYREVTLVFNDYPTKKERTIRVQGDHATIDMDGRWEPNSAIRDSEDMLPAMLLMEALLSGAELKILPKDYRTIRGSETVERNSACPCGSGLKFKKCCGKVQ